MLTASPLPLAGEVDPAKPGREGALPQAHDSPQSPLPDPPPQAGEGEEYSLRQALFAPRAVAIIGQSNDATKTAGRPLRYLRQAGFAGRIYPVNPGRASVLG